jgi:PAS domain S-box-containing protein
MGDGEMTKMEVNDGSLLRAIYENGFDAVLLMRPDGVILSANPSACRMLGLPEVKIKNASIGKFLLQWSPMTSDPPEKEEARLTFRRMDGTIFSADTVSIPFVDDESTVNMCLVIGQARNVNEQEGPKWGDRELKRFYRILSSMPYGILLVTNEDVVEFVNQAFCDMFGLTESPAELAGTTANRMIGKIRSSYADPSVAVARIKEVLSAAQPVSGEELGMTAGRTMLRDFIPIRLGGSEYGRLWIHVDITEIKRTEAALKRSERGLAAAQRIAHMGSWEWNIQTGELRWSEGLYRIYGIDPKDPVPSMETFAGFIHPDDRGLVSSQIEQVTTKGASVTFDFRIIATDGSVHHLRTNGEMLEHDPEGRPLVMVGVNQDITERLLVERTVKESQAKYHDLFETVQEVFYIDKLLYDDRGSVIDWTFEDLNPAGLKLLGLDDKEQVVGRRGSEVLGDENAAFYLPMIEEARRSDKAVTFQYHSPQVDKEFLTSYVVHGDRLITAQMDITGIKRAQRAVELSEAKYSGLFRAVQEALFIMRLVRDDKGDVVDWVTEDINPAGLRSWGFDSLSDVKGRLGSEVIGPERMKFFLPKIESALRSGKPEVFEYRSDHLGREFINSSVVIGDRYIASQIDITEIKTAQRQAEEYTKSLQRSNEELQQFAYVASHDLQEPLRMVLSYLSLLERKYRGQVDEQAQQYIDFAVEGGTRMRELIDDLLEYSRVETKGKSFVQVDMNELVLRTLSILKDAVEKSGAEIIVDDLPTLRIDESQMSQVMQNLVSNALKFRGPDRPKIVISATKGNGEWTFAVRDNGIGLDMEHSDRIFQMFQRLHTKEVYPGTGVGLAIAKKIVERHGGRIWVESREGEGATFFFTISFR